ncbi:DISARM system-associated protein DrmE [Aneurinibacillus aneurinilyticus]|uniref:DISARM system-associated protein DrmE n=1 Tax=Aneurinibacillus aneurinilyticus TaxID=1391 RepID=UPI0023F79FBD|nr:DISARM system-associated protein DrmE [Aneurinibacillus aneurinilyticus]MCI1696643.1 DISARM system-associated protein DrmE [Aneurinibacillus aneurinilyticus]
MGISNLPEDHILRLGRQVSTSSLEMDLVHNLKDVITKKRKFLLCHPNKSFWAELIVRSVVEEYILGYQQRPDFKRRLSVLIISEGNYLLEYFKSIEFPMNWIYQLGIDKHKFFNNNGEFASLDDKYYFQCNIKHYLEKVYNGDSPEKIPLHYILPISTGYKVFSHINRGKRNKIGQYDNEQQSVFYISSNPNILKEKHVPYFDYVFVDCSSISKIVVSKSLPISYFFDSNLDRRIPYLLNRDVNLYNFDPKLIPHLQLDNGEGLLTSLKHYDIQRVKINCIDTKFDNSLEEVFRCIDSLRRKGFDSYDLSLSGKLVYTLLNTPISAVDYDSIASNLLMTDTIQEQIKELKDSDNRYEDDDFESLIKAIDSMLHKYKLDSESPKQSPLLLKISEEYNRGKSIGILIPSRTISIGLKELISIKLRLPIEKLEQHKIYFFNRKKVLKGIEKVKCEIFLTFSASSLEDLKIIQLSQFNEAEVYLYRVERALLQNKLEKMVTFSNCLLDKYVGSQNYQIFTYNLYRYFLNRIKLKNNEIGPESLDVLDYIKRLKDLTKTSIRKKRAYNGKDALSAQYIEFDDATYMFVVYNTPLKVLNREAKVQEEKLPKDLKPGQEILIIDNDSRKDLYDLFIQASDQHPEKAERFILIEKWHELFEDKFITENWDDDSLYEAMKKNGWKRKSKQNFENWRMRLYYGPQDVEDIVCLGQVMGVEEFVKYANEYYQAMSAVRNEHRQISKLLNLLIYHSARALHPTYMRKLEEYSLTPENLKEVIQIKRVNAISKKTYMVRPREIGIIYTD